MTEIIDARIEAIAPEGLGFGEGSISYKNRAESDVPAEDIEQILDVITDPSKVLVEIDQEDGEYLDDDGCGDGRGVTDSSTGRVHIKQGDKLYKKSLNRAKLFGGGATMALAGEVALANGLPESLSEAFTTAMHKMDEHEIDYGAHTDENAGEIKSGCGAIDNAPVIIANAVKYQSKISDTIRSLIPDVDALVLDEVLESYESFNEIIKDSEYKGQDVMDEIDAREKVIKRLVKGHSEMFIMLNEVEHYTVNQFAVRDASKENIQVFAVDLWRLMDINDRLYDEDEGKEKAFISQLVYTLATSATLTDGTLPVYRAQSIKPTVKI